MRRFAAQSVLALLLVASGLAVLAAGPLTAVGASSLIGHLPLTARMLTVIAIGF